MPQDQGMENTQRANADLHKKVERLTQELNDLRRTLEEQTVRYRQSERIITAQRDLGFLLAGASSVTDSLRLCLDTALTATELDAGGIYMVDPAAGTFHLACVEGVSEGFAEAVRDVPLASERIRRVVSDCPAYLDRQDLAAPDYEDVRREGITAVAVIPIRNRDRLIGLLNLASRRSDDIPPESRQVLESIAAQIGMAILRARDHDALRASEQRFRDLAEKSVAGIYLVQDGSFHYANARCCEIFGYAEDEMLGLGWQTVIYPEDWTLVRENLEKRIFGEIESLHYEFRIIKKNGELRFVEIYGSRTSFRGNPAIIGTLLDITDRRLAVEELRKSEARLRQVIDLVPHGIFAKDYAGRFILVNQAVAEIYRTTVEDLTGKSDADFNPDPAEIEHFRQDDLAVMDSGAPKVIPEEPLTNAAGETRILRTVKIPFTLSASQDKAILGVFTDITEQKQAQKALQESEAKYRNIFENAVEGIYQTSPAGRLLSVNPALARMMGYASPQEMIASVADVGKQGYRSPEERTRFLRMLAEAGSVEEVEMQFRRKDGSLMWAFDNARCVYDEQGRLVCYEGSIQDITRRKVTEQALQESEAKYRSVVESSLVAFYIVQDGLFRYVNQQFCEGTGYSPEEVVDVLNPLDLVHPDDRPLVRENLEKRLAEPGKQVEYSYRVIRKDGRVITIKVFGNSMEYHGRRAVCGTAIDITHEKAMESQLRQAQKMESIGTLAGGIAHDFNNILGGMIGYAELAEMKTSDPRIKPYLEQVLRAGNRAKNLVNQILTFSRRKENEKKPLSLTPIVKEALKLIRSTLPATVEVRLNCENGWDTVLADPTQIHQVLINLCTNAAHAMRERGGVLDVQVSREDASAGPAGGDFLEKGPQMKLVVRDTGHGIDPAIMDKIFDPFYTTKAQGEGTGLGLSMVYGIVENHQGTIAVASKPGEGATFTVRLPLIDAEAGSAEQRKADIPTGRGHVLFVDDEELLASSGKEMLSALGYEVTVQFNSLDALAAFRANPDRFDLVITDMTMPTMTGDVLAGELLKLRPGLPIILTSGFLDKMNEERSKRIGIREFIMKPMSLDQLARTVSKLLDRPPA